MNLESSGLHVSTVRPYCFYIAPTAAPKSSTVGTEEFQEGNYFWNSYVLRLEHVTSDVYS